MPELEPTAYQRSITEADLEQILARIHERAGTYEPRRWEIHPRTYRWLTTSNDQRAARLRDALSIPHPET